MRARRKSIDPLSGDVKGKSSNLRATDMVEEAAGDGSLFHHDGQSLASLKKEPAVNRLIWFWRWAAPREMRLSSPERSRFTVCAAKLTSLAILWVSNLYAANWVYLYQSLRRS